MNPPGILNSLEGGDHVTMTGHARAGMGASKLVELRGIIVMPVSCSAFPPPDSACRSIHTDKLELEPEPGRVATKLSLRLESGAYYPVARAGSLLEALASPRVKKLVSQQHRGLVSRHITQVVCRRRSPRH